MPPMQSSFEYIGGQFVDPTHTQLCFNHRQPSLDLYHPTRLDDLQTPPMRSDGDRDGAHAVTVTDTTFATLSSGVPVDHFAPQAAIHPQLTLRTTHEEMAMMHQDRAVSPTPEIIFEPADFVAAVTDHPDWVNHTGNRARSVSSPATYWSQSLAGDNTHVSCFPPGESYDYQLLSPIRAWNSESYHPGDRLSFMDHVNSLPLPAAASSSQNSAPMPTTARKRTKSVYFCEHEGCKRRGKPFNTESELRKHQRVHIPKDQRPLPCPECEQRFFHPKDVRRHMLAKHRGGMASQCDLCGQVLTREDNLQRHMFTQHDIAMTPSSMASDAASPASTVSEAMHSDTSPTTVDDPSWSPAQTTSPSLQHRRLLPANMKPHIPMTASKRRAAPTSVPMFKSKSNEL